MRYITLCFTLLLSLVLIYSCGTESTPIYTLITSVTGEGSITPAGGEYEEGETVTLTATPDEHWVFSNWSGDGSGASSTTTITLDGNKNVVGNFIEREYTINYTINGSGDVEEEVIQPKGEYTVGTMVQLTPIPISGWKFVEWNNWDGEVDEENRIVITVDGETNVTVTFERIDYPLTITIDGEGEVEQSVVQPKTTEYPFETVVKLRSKPKDGWVFYQWNGDLSGDDNPETIEVDESKDITSVFKSIDELLTIEITGEGTVDIQQESFEDNPSRRTVTLTPNPSQYWKFEEWSGDVSSNVEVIEVKIDGEKNITARFTTPVLLGENGITIMCPDGEVGDIGIVNGVEYEVVDRNLLNQRIEEGKGSLNRRVCVSLVRNMGNLFEGLNFNYPIGDWDVGNVTTMNEMFLGSQFNHPIRDWDVSNVTNMGSMFRSNSHFNSPIGDWDVSNVTNMSNMFSGTTFNQPIGDWDVSNVTNMSRMFHDASFNHPLGNWDVSNVTDMSSTFSGGYRNLNPFNQPIGDWDVSNVTSMAGMFAGGYGFLNPFNQPIGGWNVSKVTNMSSMFSKTRFNKPINKWCVSQITSEPMFFSTSSPLIEENKPVWGTCPD